MTKRTRTRSTWAAEQKAAEQKEASPPPATPGYAEYWGDAPHPAAQQDPNADDYKNGDTSSWAEDVHPGPYPPGPQPAIPTTELDHPATKRAAQQWAEKKAMACLSIAERMLGRTASTNSVERQAFSLMSLPDKEIQATLKRMGGGFLGMDDMMGDQSNNDMYYDLNLANDMGEDEVYEDEDVMGTDDFDDDDMGDMGDMMGMYGDEGAVEEEVDLGPMAFYARQMKAMARTMKAMKNEITVLKGGTPKMSSEDMLAEMFRTAGDDEDEDDSEEGDDDAADDSDDDDDDDGKDAGKKKKGSDDEDDDDKDDDDGKKASASDRMLAEMYRQAAEDADKDDEDDDEGEGKEAGLEIDFGLTASDEMASEIQFDGGESQVIAGFDPMGVGSTPDADDALLAEVFGGHTASQIDQLRAARMAGDRNASDALRPTAKTGPRAATQRPQPRKANQGAQHLGQVRVASGPSQNQVLEGMWDAAPDVSGHFS